MKKEQLPHYGKRNPVHPLLIRTNVLYSIISTSHHMASNSNNKEFGNMLRMFIMIAFGKQNISPEDGPV
eukprot:15003952-Ditylum_brightwellii.AAC.1